MIKQLMLALVFIVGLGSVDKAEAGTCGGRFVNPITDICWSCLFPMSVGGLKVWDGRADTDNPALPVCACPTPVPRVGVAMGFWEPVRLIDVTTKSWCFPNLGGVTINPGIAVKNGTVDNNKGGSNSSSWQAHYYVYPLVYWMELLVDFACMETSSFDLAYVSELDPSWQDDKIAAFLSPEIFLFANPIAAAACVADCAAATVTKGIDQLFWCSGCQGYLYPLNGNVANHGGLDAASRLVAERMLARQHRMGLAWGTYGGKALCNKYLMPIMKKQQYRLQQVNPVAMTKGKGSCSAIGHSTADPRTARSYPVKGEDFGFLVWRKRNCCVL